jgi:hypothetical protein
MVIARLGHLPTKAGESVRFDGWTAEVTSVERRAVTGVRFRPATVAANGPPDNADRPPDNADRPPNKADGPPDKADGPPDKADRAPNKADRPPDNRDPNENEPSKN